MNTGVAVQTEATVKPRLVFFHSSFSGHCRRVEGFLAQVLQRRRNHGTFQLYRVASEDILLLRSRPDGISARNVLRGRVLEVESVGQDVVVRVETSGLEWRALVTEAFATISAFAQDLSSSPSSLAFGNVYIGVPSGSKVLTITNISGGGITINSSVRTAISAPLFGSSGAPIVIRNCA